MAEQVFRPVIMIAEDDPDDRLMMADAFSERCAECRLCFARNGSHLMQLLDSGKTPDLILLDLNMPLMDGREALLKIRANPAMQRIPTVVMTTSDNEEDARSSYSAGASSYIVKPSRYSELLDIVSELKGYWVNTDTLPEKH